ncbi:hypothetical protein VOLCADRAFT_85844 [Volvox carteri f. nagariensis]|uniref:Uncharacterized protein n=1 Tax=Volvox carteri f. nagariensis TaxID=3068 RepID=D8TH51_VOLCA|nr:uncharacterized protein VOLCADRAFT_85844 [Volvox carteri f. nagariensis]EFJ52650.1 hypothetical protein VOLCADRAFT_85844 [Volvox carteri f. nagariensis]|eukprot:XP_002945655.1 hypothetical protein VOLCADRAFT_85844 [Volvox carteri f. nagariensis]
MSTQQDPYRAHYVGREIQLYGAQPRFQGDTSYLSDFTPHPIEPRPPVAERQYAGNPAPFDGNSCYKQDYRQHSIEPRPPATGPQWQPNPAPFDGTTTNRENYRGHPIEPRPAVSPRPYNPNTAPFDGNTSYKQDFTQHPLERRQPYNAGSYQPNPAPFDGTTHYKADYKPHQIEPRAPAPPTAPSLPPMRPTASFDGSSTYNRDYKGWKLPPRRPALGVQMMGDRTYVLIPSDAPLPATGKQIFTTVHDNQTEICVLVLRGDATAASRNNVLGQFDLKGLPPGPRGNPRIEITLTVDANNVLSATATDLDAQRHEQWLREGSMEARKHSTDVTNVL